MAEKSLETVLQQLRQVVGAPSTEELADQQLLLRFTQQQEEAAFATLVRRHGPMVFGVCRRVLRDAHQAEDAFQATFLVLARKASSIRKQESLASWLYGVAYRVAGKSRASARRRSALERRAMGMRQAEQHEPQPRPELEEALDQELHKLPDKYRAPLVLCYLQGMTNEEAAQQLGWTTGTVRGRLFRGRDLLRGRLVRRGLGMTSGVALTAFMAEAAHASPPAALMEATIRAGMLFAKGKGAGVVSAQAAAMADGALRGMFWDQFKAPALITVTAGLASLAAFVAYGAITDRPPVLPGPAVDPIVNQAGGVDVGAGTREVGLLKELGITGPGHLGALAQDQGPLGAEVTLLDQAGAAVAEQDVTFRWQGGQEVLRTDSRGVTRFDLERGSIENLRVVFPHMLTPRFRLVGRDGQEYVLQKLDPSHAMAVPAGFAVFERPGLQVLVPTGKQPAGAQAIKDLEEMRLLVRALTGQELATPCRLVLFAQGQAMPSNAEVVQFPVPLADYEAALAGASKRPAEMAQWLVLHRWTQMSLTVDAATVQDPTAQFAKSGLAEALAFAFCRKHYPAVAACRLRAFETKLAGMLQRGETTFDLRQNYNQAGGALAFLYWRNAVEEAGPENLKELAAKVKHDPAGSLEGVNLVLNLSQCKTNLGELIKECERQGS